MSGIVELINQNEVWVDGNKKIHRIAEMDIMHARNLVRYLTEGDRPRMTVSGVLNACMSGPVPRGDVAQDGFDSMIEHLMHVHESQRRAREWLLEQPLLKALTERAAAIYEKPVKVKPEYREVAIVVKVKVAVDFDATVLEYEVEDALRPLGYDLEVLGMSGG